MDVQNVLDQFLIKLIQIRYIQIRYIQFRVKIGWLRLNQTRGRNSSNRAPARRSNNDRAPARQTTRTFFPVVITIAHPPDRRLEFFFPVVITIAHPPDRQLELFFPFPPAHAKRGRFLQPTQSECICFSVRLSVCEG